MDPRIDQNHIETLHETRFLSLYDLQYAEGRHYYVASRRTKDDLVAVKSGQEAKKMLPDAVTIAVVIRLPGEDPKLLLFYEYRYPAGRFLLSPVAGLIDEADRKDPDPLVTAAVREIREEIGLTVKETDSVRVVIPCSYCTPGLTDETNAFLLAEITLDSLDGLTHSGTEGSELMEGFELFDRERAERIYRSGRDDRGNFYSLATWTVIGIYLSLF